MVNPEDRLVEQVEERLRGSRDYLRPEVREKIKQRAIEVALHAFQQTFTSSTFDTREHFRLELEKLIPEVLSGEWRVVLRDSDPGEINADLHPLDPNNADVLKLNLVLSF